LSFCANNFADR